MTWAPFICQENSFFVAHASPGHYQDPAGECLFYAHSNLAALTYSAAIWQIHTHTGTGIHKDPPCRTRQTIIFGSLTSDVALA